MASLIDSDQTVMNLSITPNNGTFCNCLVYTKDHKSCMKFMEFKSIMGRDSAIFYYE